MTERKISVGRHWLVGVSAAIGLIIGSGLPPMASRGQIAPDPSLGKPVPKGGEVTAVKGQKMTIELVSEAKTRASVVEFLIRDFPLNGKLGPLVSNDEDRTRASITYTAFADTAVTTDSFTFAARYPGGLFSQKVKVEITLEASEPKIHATAEADFGRVMLGQSETKEIFLSNSGNASYRNQITLSAPWSMVEPANGLLDLPIGGQRTVEVRFTPMVEGPATFHLAFFRNQGATTRLKGAGYAPFSVAEESVALRWEEKSRTRLAEITVTGNSPKLLPITVESDERLRINGGNNGFLRPNEPGTFQIYLPSTDSAAYRGQVQFVAGSYRVPIAVSAEIAPGYVAVENTGTGEMRLEFGALKPGGIAQSSFQLHNVGGTPVKIRLGCEAPFTILAAGGRATLDPQETEAFAVRVTAPEDLPGPYQGTLRIEADNGQIIQVPLQAFFQGSTDDPNAGLRMQATAPGFSPSAADSPPAPAGSSVPPSDRPPGSSSQGATPRHYTQEEHDRAIAEMDKLRSPLGFITFPLVKREIVASLPPVSAEGIHLIEEGRRHLIVGWPAPAAGMEDFELEMRVMRAEEGGMAESLWAPYYDVEFSTGKDGDTAAEIRGLIPNATYEFRVFTLGDDGQVSEPLAFAAKTKMPLDWTWIYIGFGVFVVALLAVLTRRWWMPESSSRSAIPGISHLRDLLGKAE